MAEETVASSKGGPNAYALGIVGDMLAPDLRDGDRAVFCPDAGRAECEEIAAIWPKGKSSPVVFRLASAVPPEAIAGKELRGMLALHTNRGDKMIPMDQVARVDRLVDVIRSGRSAFIAAQW